jgi:hypothetical protein
MHGFHSPLSFAWLAAMIVSAAAPASGETLKYELFLFGVEVAEIQLTSLGADRMRLRGETSGALTLFFPATETVDVETSEGRPVRVVRRFEHGKKKGEWRLAFRKRRVELRAEQGGKRVTRVFKTREPVYDPTTALARLRALAPVEKVSMLLFGIDAIYRFEARRVSESPLLYRGTFRAKRRFHGKKRRRPPPRWLHALGFGRGATKRPELSVWLTGDARRIPTRIRMTDPRGAVELRLVEPSVDQTRGASAR